MPQLSDLKCIPCRGDTPPATLQERSLYLLQTPDWTIVEVEQMPRLERTFKFKSFAQALAFTNQVGDLAEAEGHHPLLQTEWGRVKVSWWTHAIKGLHHNDFIMAAKTDVLYSQTSQG